MSKELILKRIKEARAKHAIQGANPVYRNIIKVEFEDLVEEYKHFQVLNKAEVIESAKENLEQAILKALENFQSKKVLHSTDLDLNFEAFKDFALQPYDKEIEAMREELFEIDTALLHGVCGISSLGMIGAVSSHASPRLLSLITLNCIILLKKESIVRNLSEGVQALKNQSQNGALPTNMLLIGGPSRTADIELKTVFGVHGPQKVAVILY
ncbi:lactate utilization protein C [Helicobacter pylori]|uniref:Lactate utilization protein C n=1 Tax=Helicobacter pylori TaxID=210 RepID=A0A518YGL7_HELPX|nr:lactate utilization protein C [Helicobacter pylori]QDY61207.1 lactate utilization protein C [Helicobacter pylori]